MPSIATLRCWTSEPSASTQLPASPSVGILTLDHLTSSGEAMAGLVGAEKDRLKDKINPSAVINIF